MDALKHKVITLYSKFLEEIKKGHTTNYLEILQIISFINLPIKVEKFEFIKQRLLNKDDTEYLNLNIIELNSNYNITYSISKEEISYLTKQNYLSEFNSELEKSKVRQNLGISDNNIILWGNISGHIEHQLDIIQYIETIKSGSVKNTQIGYVSSIDNYIKSGIYEGFLNNNKITLIVVANDNSDVKTVGLILYELNDNELVYKFRLGKGYNYIIWDDWFLLNEVGLKQFISQEVSRVINLPEDIIQKLQEIVDWIKNNEDISHLTESIQINAAAIQSEKSRAENVEQQILKLFDKTVYLSSSEYEQLLKDNLVEDDVEYNIFEDE